MGWAYFYILADAARHCARQAQRNQCHGDANAICTYLTYPKSTCVCRTIGREVVRNARGLHVAPIICAYDASFVCVLTDSDASIAVQLPPPYVLTAPSK